MWKTGLTWSMWALHLRDGDHGTPQYAAPMLTSDFSGFPPTYLEVDEFDCLHDEGVTYTKAQEATGGGSTAEATQPLQRTTEPDCHETHILIQWHGGCTDAECHRIFSAWNGLPVGVRHLHVVAYCRVSTELEEQTSSIKLQGQHYSQMLS